MLKTADEVRELATLTRADVDVAGGKGANLGELATAGLPVPPGFVLTAGAYTESMEAGGVRATLRERLAEALRAANDPNSTWWERTDYLLPCSTAGRRCSEIGWWPTAPGKGSRKSRR